MTTDCTRQSPREVIVQGGLLKRIGAWFGAAAATAVIGMAVRA
jgi:hypothetical protein